MPYADHRSAATARRYGTRALAGTLAALALAAGFSTPASAGPRPVAEVTSAGVTVTFVAGAGQRTIAMRVRGRLDGPASPVPALIAQHLTHLEIYLALAPRGATAPPVLARAQAAEAAELGRDAAVRTAVVPAAPSVRSSTPQDCENIILRPRPPQPWDLWWFRAATYYGSGPSSQYVGGSSNWDVFTMAALGVCNESATTITYHTSYDYLWDAAGWVNNSDDSVRPGGYAAWYFYAPKGRDSAGRLHGTAFEITGVNGAFDLVTAEADDDCC